MAAEAVRGWAGGSPPSRPFPPRERLLVALRHPHAAQRQNRRRAAARCSNDLWPAISQQIAPHIAGFTDAGTCIVKLPLLIFSNPPACAGTAVATAPALNDATVSAFLILDPKVMRCPHKEGRDQAPRTCGVLSRTETVDPVVAVCRLPGGFSSTER